MKTGISSRLGVVQLYGRHRELQTLAPQSRINAGFYPETTRRQNREQSQLWERIGCFWCVLRGNYPQGISRKYRVTRALAQRKRARRLSEPFNLVVLTRRHAAYHGCDEFRCGAAPRTKRLLKVRNRSAAGCCEPVRTSANSIEKPTRL